MAEVNMDGYMYFVGPGKYGVREKRKSLGEIKGETPDKRFSAKGAFQIWYFKWSSSHKNESDNRRDSRCSVGAFEIRKDVDIATPTIFLAHAHCAVFEGCHIYFRKTGGSKLFTFFHAIFSDVIIEKWECNLDNGTEEKLTVNFDWCEINYYPQSRDGVRKKGDAANMNQFCTSTPDSQDAPRVMRKQGGDVSAADMDLLFGGE